MNVQLTKKQIRYIISGLNTAIQSEEALVDCNTHSLTNKSINKKVTNASKKWIGRWEKIINKLHTKGL